MTALPVATAPGAARGLFPGVLACCVVAAASTFLSEHYGAPVMLFALLLGLAMNFLSAEGPCAAGIAFTGREVAHAVGCKGEAGSDLHGGHTVGRRCSRNWSRSLFFCILPVAPSGIASTNTTSSGVHHLAILPS